MTVTGKCAVTRIALQEIEARDPVGLRSHRLSEIDIGRSGLGGERTNDRLNFRTLSAVDGTRRRDEDHRERNAVCFKKLDRLSVQRAIALRLRVRAVLL